MRRLTLQRRKESLDGTLGELLELGLKCIEEEERGNEPGESRIPAGEYRCVRSYFHRGRYHTYEVTGVPGRSRILFHIGNTEEDSQGCILPGMDWGRKEVRDEDGGGVIREKIAVLRSREAFNRFMAWADKDEEFLLRILDPVPGAPEPVIRLVDSIDEEGP